MATAKQLQESDPSDDRFDAKVKVLGEYIDHHVREEEQQMFPQTRKARMACGRSARSCPRGRGS